MRVLCINNKPLPGWRNGGLDLIKEGHIYTVLSVCWNGGLYLQEVEAPNGKPYHEDRFVPLTGEDTETLEEMEINQLLNA